MKFLLSQSTQLYKSFSEWYCSLKNMKGIGNYSKLKIGNFTLFFCKNDHKYGPDDSCDPGNEIFYTLLVTPDRLTPILGQKKFQNFLKKAMDYPLITFFALKIFCLKMPLYVHQIKRLVKPYY